MAPNPVATPRPVMTSAAVGGAAPVTRKKTAARASPPKSAVPGANYSQSDEDLCGRKAHQCIIKVSHREV